MSRPAALIKDETLYWVIRLYDNTNALVDADSTPTVAIRKNGAATADAVTVTKRAATTGIYDCSYNPASEIEGDQFTVEESATISLTSYSQSWEFYVADPMRGTDAADVPSAVWDASLSSYNVGGTTGKSLKQIKEGTITIESSINDTAATTTSFVTALTETTTSFYSNKIMVFTAGNLSGQARIITNYNGTTKTITLEEPLTSAPADGDQFLILATHENSIEEIQNGLAKTTDLATVTKTGVQYTATAQSGDTIQVTLS